MKPLYVGRLLGAFLGLWLGHGWIGAIIGYFAGSRLDDWLEHQLRRQTSSQQVSELFFQASFTFMGFMAKADGVVTTREINIVENIMQQLHLDRMRRQEAIQFFYQGRDGVFNLEDLLEALRARAGTHRALLEMFIDLQWIVANADGMTESKQRLIHFLCRHLAPDPFSYAYFMQRYQAFSEGRTSQSQGTRQRTQTAPHVHVEGDPFQLLGISREATPQEIKLAYRRLIRQHHPDKLIAQGLPKDMIRIATEKTQALHAAYRKVRELKGF